MKYCRLRTVWNQKPIGWHIRNIFAFGMVRNANFRVRNALALIKGEAIFDMV